MAPLEGLAGHDAGRRSVLQAQDGRVLGGLAHARPRRRAAPRALRHQAELWVERYLDWCGFWADFLEDRTVVDGRRVYTHERLRRARSSLSSLVSAGTLFTYLDPALAKAGPLPSTNNMIEGGVNSQLRAVLRNHRGLTSVKRVKAVFWWCHAHSGDARTAREKLATMPTDADIDFLFSVYSASPSREDGGPEWGDRAVWEDLHHRDPYPFWLD